MARSNKVEPGLLKRMADLVDGDAWEMADLLAEKFPEDEYGSPGDHAKTGLHEELVDYEMALIDEYGIDQLKANTMRIYRATALAWPDDARASSVPFVVCQRFRGEKRFEQVERYLRKNKGKPLTLRAAMRYRTAEAGSGHVRTWEEQVARRIERAAKAALLEGIKADREDWWNASQITDSRRQVVIAALRKLAKDMGS